VRSRAAIASAALAVSPVAVTVFMSTNSARKDGVRVKCSPLLEIPRVLVRFDHVASIIVNANDGITAFDPLR
jgi:hypothetical protein